MSRADEERKYGNSVNQSSRIYRAEIDGSLPVAGDATANRIPRIPTVTMPLDNWQQARDECVSLQSQFANHAGTNDARSSSAPPSDAADHGVK